MNIESNKYDIKNMSINKLRSNEMLLRLSNEGQTRCIIEVSHNGIEIVYKLFTNYDQQTEYLLKKEKINQQNNKKKIIDNFLIKLD